MDAPPLRFSSSTTGDTESQPRCSSPSLAYRGEAQEAVGMYPLAECHPIITETKESLAFYRDRPGLSFTEEADGCFHPEALERAKRFAMGQTVASLLCPEGNLVGLTYTRFHT